MLTSTGTASERWPGDPGNSSVGRFAAKASKLAREVYLNRCVHAILLI